MLIACIEELSQESVAFICRSLAAEVVARSKLLCPEAQVAIAPQAEEKKAASLRRQWYRWKSGEHAPDSDDLAALLAVARREGWIAWGGTAHSGLPANVNALIETVDQDEANRWGQRTSRTLDAIETELWPIADYVIELAGRLPAGAWDVGLVVNRLSLLIFKSLDKKVQPLERLPLGGAGSMLAAATVISASWQSWASGYQEDEEHALQLHNALLAMSVPKLLAQFEALALERGFWPEDFSTHMGHLMQPGVVPPPESGRVVEFRRLLLEFAPSQKLNFKPMAGLASAKLSKLDASRSAQRKNWILERLQNTSNIKSKK